MDRILRLLTWPAAFYIAGTLLWYEQYKLTGNEGSVYLFTILSDWLFIHGYEKPFRLFVAAMEIVASILVLIPATRVFGAAFALGIMSVGPTARQPDRQSPARGYALLRGQARARPHA